MARRNKTPPAFTPLRCVSLPHSREKSTARNAIAKQTGKLGFTILILLSSVASGILVARLWPSGGSAHANAITNFESVDSEKPVLILCEHSERFNCVVDGDTIWLYGEKIRIADIDTPEISSPQCQYEYELGIEAKLRLRDLLNESPWSLSQMGSRDTDQYGRKLRVVERNGTSIGSLLVSEGLARRWTGRRAPWC